MSPSIDILARRRYPRAPLLAVVDWFLDDRRAAGLGALDEARRRPRGGPVRNVKYFDYLSERVIYRARIVRPERLEFEPYRPETLLLGNRASATRTARRLPPVNVAFNEAFHAYELQDQHGRDHIAHVLRKHRQQMREHVARAACVI